MPTRILLRNVVDDDIPLFFKHQSDPEASRIAAFPIREREAFTAHWARIRRDKTVVTRTILRDGAVVGYVGSFTRSGVLEKCGFLLCGSQMDGDVEELIFELK